MRCRPCDGNRAPTWLRIGKTLTVESAGNEYCLKPIIDCSLCMTSSKRSLDHSKYFVGCVSDLIQVESMLHCKGNYLISKITFSIRSVCRLSNITMCEQSTLPAITAKVIDNAPYLGYQYLYLQIARWSMNVCADSIHNR